jgi:hypothetical protein
LWVCVARIYPVEVCLQTLIGLNIRSGFEGSRAE